MKKYFTPTVEVIELRINEDFLDEFGHNDDVKSDNLNDNPG